jgi:MFS family permease
LNLLLGEPVNSGTRGLSVSALIDERPLSRFQIRVVALCGLIMVLDGLDALCIGFLAPAIADDLGIPLPRFGPVFASSLFGLMVAAMVSRPVADRWGRKWVIVISTLTFASFAIMTARATSLEELVLWRFLTGLGLGGATGVGWASRIGRTGSIIGPTLGGILLSMQWTPRQISLAATLPALGAATAATMRKDAG